MDDKMCCCGCPLGHEKQVAGDWLINCPFEDEYYNKRPDDECNHEDEYRREFSW